MRFGYYKPHAKQLWFHALGAKSVERVFLAGNGTGKTFCGAMEVCMHVTGVYPPWWEGRRFNRGVTVWVLGESNEVVRTTLQQYYVGSTWMGKAGGIYHELIVKKTMKKGVNDAVDQLWVEHSSGQRSSVSFKSYEQGQRKLQSASVDIVHCDEEPPYAIYEELRVRTMRVENGMLLITATPLMGLTRVVQSFLEGDGQRIAPGVIIDGRSYVTASWADNPYLPEPEKERMRKTMSPHEREVREHGIPSIGSGLVYPIMESRIVVDPIPIPDYWARLYGIDFGWNPSPTAVLFGAHDRDQDILYIIGEYAATELTPQKHAFNLLERNAHRMWGVYDPAGKISAQKDGEKIVHLYMESGLKYLCAANNSVESGLMRVMERLETGRLKIFSSLHGFLSEFRSYSRDTNGIIKKGNDHYMDCMRYMVMSGLGIAQPLDRMQVHHPTPPTHGGRNWMGA